MQSKLSPIVGHAHLFLAFSLLAGGDALAEDAKTNAGSQCVSASGSISYSTSSAAGGAYNSSSSSTATWICPLVRDSTDSDPVDDTTRITIYDPSSSYAFSCTQYERYVSGSVVSGGTSTGSNGSASSTGYTSFTLSGSLPEISYTGWYYLQCTVPPAARLYSYWSEEND